jgi:hypothetical protein
MKAVVALIIILIVLVPKIAAATQTVPGQAGRVSVSYVLPKNPVHEPIYELLKEIRFLEKVHEFLSRVRLPRTVGALLDTTFHEFAHAMFDMLRVPVLGREEDAADQVSAYIMLHLGKTEARRLIAGAAYVYKTEAEAAKTPVELKQFADAHGTPAQRFYNLLCIAYGADPESFGDVVKKGHLPKERAEDCKDEYQQVAYAYQNLIGQHIDLLLAKVELDTGWLPDAKWQLPRRSGSAQTK